MDRKKNLLDKIGALIPGYKGYSERDGRRDTDKITRESICLNLNEIEKNISKQLKKNEHKSDLFLIYENLRKKVNTINTKIKYLEYGFTSFFNDVQIKENELEEIYKIDLEIQNEIKNFNQKKGSENIEELEIFIDKCNDFLLKRKLFLNKFK